MESMELCQQKFELCQRTKCQRFSRIVGYYRPLSQWNDGKQAEWEERKTFSLQTLPKL